MFIASAYFCNKKVSAKYSFKFPLNFFSIFPFEFICNSRITPSKYSLKGFCHEKPSRVASYQVSVNYTFPCFATHTKLYCSEDVNGLKSYRRCKRLLLKICSSSNTRVHAFEKKVSSKYSFNFPRIFSVIFQLNWFTRESFLQNIWWKDSFMKSQAKCLTSSAPANTTEYLLAKQKNHSSC